MAGLSEQDLISKYFAPLAGPGGLGLLDDAALLAPPPGTELVLTADALVAGVHFFAEDPPEKIALKALAVNLSDLAAKGADPLGFLLALALPSDWTPDWLAAFARGLGEMAAQDDCPLLGGDTVATPGPLTLSITALGCVPTGKMVRRTTARPSDALYISGTIGDAALGLALRKSQITGEQKPAWAQNLAPEQCEALVDRYLTPRPRKKLVSALRACASAAMDVSDGLIGDLRAMMRASGVTAQVELRAQVDLRQIPLSGAASAAFRADPDLLERILCGGDDYEILCALPIGAAARFEAFARATGVAVTRIGSVAGPGEAEVFSGFDGRPRAFGRDRFSHF
jgi:thiamine-monophosphate kinase